ncbi:hypothetical protein FG386_003057 [Cryptosporidium ryanae]|uniref:uncharacterized protein n=1 Tax=Cryptosporidium ryanae TaxID=515981 RepID=UPI00351A7D80|nr:hypothetical protein FG386_003057 [Cryptosporidium ryanae]
MDNGHEELSSSSSLEVSRSEHEVNPFYKRDPSTYGKDVNLISDHSLVEGDYEEASGSDSLIASERSESKQPGLVVEVPLGRLHAIKKSEQGVIKRELQLNSIDRFKPHVKPKHSMRKNNLR